MLIDTCTLDHAVHYWLNRFVGGISALLAEEKTPIIPVCITSS